MYLWEGTDNKKYIGITTMNTCFLEMLEHFNQAQDDAERSKIYDEMEEYAYSYRPDYSCYDVDMYVALYKCAKTNQQREHALVHIQDIIDDGALNHEELIENLKQFVSIKDSLKEEDEEKFDTICMKAFNFFDKELVWAYDQAMCGQADFYPDVPLGVTEREREEVSEIIVSTDMRNLESYQAASSVLGL